MAVLSKCEFLIVGIQKQHKNEPTKKKKKNKNNTTKVRKAADGCPSMPEAVGLRLVVASVTERGQGSWVKCEDLLQDLTAGWGDGGGSQPGQT